MEGPDAAIRIPWNLPRMLPDLPTESQEITTLLDLLEQQESGESVVFPFNVTPWILESSPVNLHGLPVRIGKEVGRAPFNDEQLQDLLWLRDEGEKVHLPSCCVALVSLGGASSGDGSSDGLHCSVAREAVSPHSLVGNSTTFWSAPASDGDLVEVLPERQLVASGDMGSNVGAWHCGVVPPRRWWLLGLAGVSPLRLVLMVPSPERGPGLIPRAKTDSAAALAFWRSWYAGRFKLSEQRLVDCG